jgi:hypothetical protein
MVETLFTHWTYPALCKRVSFGGNCTQQDLF